MTGGSGGTRFGHGDGSHLRLLHGNFTHEPEPDRTAFVEALRAAAAAATDEELEQGLDSSWRTRLTTAWLLGVDRRTHFRHHVADLLLGDGTCYAGQGLCLALARFGTAEDADALSTYLDRNLPHPDRRYDQPWALDALRCIDARTGTDRAAAHLGPAGHWHSWSRAAYDGRPPPTPVGDACALLDRAEGLGPTA